MEINVDLENVPEFENLPEGEYVVQVKSIEVKDSKRTPGNKNLEVNYTILEPGDYAGKEVRFDVLSLAQKALFRVRDFVQACGVHAGPNGFKTEELVGAVLRIQLRLEAQQEYKTDINTGQTVLAPRFSKDNKPMLRSRVSGYAPR